MQSRNARCGMADDAENTYNTRPPFNQKFKPTAVKVLIGAVMSERLADKAYSSEAAAQWSREISDEIKTRCADPHHPASRAAAADASPCQARHNPSCPAASGTLPPRCTSRALTRACARPALRGRIKSEFDLPRYKLVVQVLIGEQRGEGIRYGGRCLWDPNTDAYAEDTYRNDSLFCVASAYGVYLY